MVLTVVATYDSLFAMQRSIQRCIPNHYGTMTIVYSYRLFATRTSKKNEILYYVMRKTLGFAILF